MKPLSWLSFGLALVIAVWAGSAQAASSACATWGEGPGIPPGGFCVYPGSPDTVLYYLHGKGGTETRWADEAFYTRQLRDEWAAQGIPAPTVISVSFGPLWIMAQKNASDLSGLFEYFTGQILPMLESKLPAKPAHRWLLGESMGGINTLELALKTPLFERSASLCATISTASPFASSAEIKATVEASRAWSYYGASSPDTVWDNIKFLMGAAKIIFPTPADWATADPLVLSKSALPNPALKVYLAVGFYDPYANYEANELLAQQLREQGISVQWRPQWGGHCAIDIPSLAAFLKP